MPWPPWSLTSCLPWRCYGPSTLSCTSHLPSVWAPRAPSQVCGLPLCPGVAASWETLAGELLSTLLFVRAYVLAHVYVLCAVWTERCCTQSTGAARSCVSAVQECFMLAL